MKPRQTSPMLDACLRRRFLAFLAILSLATLVIDFRSSAQGQVQVTAADPALAEQGTVNLNVKVTGKGFKNGAKAKWFVTGTTDTGGVTVNSTNFVSSTEVTANITVADTAVISNFDIQVLNSDGRGGKGTELFRVTAKGSNGGGGSNCPPIQPAPTSDTKCYAAVPGCLDASFGGVGFVQLDATPATPTDGEGAYALAVQPDGKILVVGRTSPVSTQTDAVLIRYNVDGTFDTSFGDPDPFNPSVHRGYTVTSLGPAAELIKSMVLQPDGKIVISAFANYSSVIVRYNNDGSLDPGFGTAGVVRLSSDAPYYELALQADGKILVGGGDSFNVARLNANGSLDSSFGVGGLVTANPSSAKRGSGHGWSLAIQRVPAVTGEERIVLAGWASSNSGTDWALMRFKSNGATDTTFGSNGIVKTPFFGFGDQARRVRIDSSNRIVVAGFMRSASDNCGNRVMDAAVVRYTQNGSLDGSFSGGKQIADIYGGAESLYAMELQNDGKVLILVTAHDSNDTVHHLALVRFNVDGTRDTSFGTLGNGVVTTDFHGVQDWGLALAIQPGDGKIIAAGTTYLQVVGDNIAQIVVARYLP